MLTLHPFHNVQPRPLFPSSKHVSCLYFPFLHFLPWPPATGNTQNAYKTNIQLAMNNEGLVTPSVLEGKYHQILNSEYYNRSSLHSSPFLYPLSLTSH